jgi:G3E family GTPase
MVDDGDAPIGPSVPRRGILPVDLHRTPVPALLQLLFDANGYSLDYVAPAELKRLSGRMQLLSSAASQRLRSLAVPSHTEDIVSCIFESTAALDLDRLNAFFDAAQQRYGVRLWRYKGVVYAQNQRPRLVVQGVQNLLQITGGTMWRASPNERCSFSSDRHSIPSGSSVNCRAARLNRVRRPKRLRYASGPPTEAIRSCEVGWPCRMSTIAFTQ